MSPPTLADGIRAGLPLVLPTLIVAVSFGVLAHPVLGAPAAIVMSLIVYAGSSQFAVLAALGSGGAVGPAVATGLLLNARFLPMGFAVGPSLPGRALTRGAQAQAIVDASWGLSATGDGRFDRNLMVGSSLPQYAAWTLGTVAGVFGGSVIGDPSRFGLDVVFPAFYLALLVGELRSGRRVAAALLAVAITLVLIPVVPAGIPVVAASAAALIGLVGRRPPGLEPA